MKTLAQWVIQRLGGITSSQWSQVLRYVVSAEEKITSGVDKKAWVLDKLKNLGVTGRTANFLTEAAVTFLRKYSTEEEV